MRNRVAPSACYSSVSVVTRHVAFHERFLERILRKIAVNHTRSYSRRKKQTSRTKTRLEPRSSKPATKRPKSVYRAKRTDDSDTFSVKILFDSDLNGADDTTRLNPVIRFSIRSILSGGATGDLYPRTHYYPLSRVTLIYCNITGGKIVVGRFTDAGEGKGIKNIRGYFDPVTPVTLFIIYYFFPRLSISGRKKN